MWQLRTEKALHVRDVNTILYSLLTAGMTATSPTSTVCVHVYVCAVCVRVCRRRDTEETVCVGAWGGEEEGSKWNRVHVTYERKRERELE